MLSWDGYSAAEQKQLSALYVPYLGLGKYRLPLVGISVLSSLAVLMGTDMFLRLRSTLLLKSKTQ